MRNLERTYFRQYPFYFWKWENDPSYGDQPFYLNTVVMPNIGVILYTDYLKEILGQLYPQGWPRLGALLLVIYASNKYVTSLDSLKYHLHKLEKSAATGYAPDAITFLEHIHDLPLHYKEDAQKLILLSKVFKQAHGNISVEKSRKIFEGFDTSNDNLLITNDDDDEISESQMLHCFQHDIKVLALLHRKYPTEKSILNLLTDEVADFTEVAKETFIESEEETDLLTALSNNSDTQAISTLIPHLIAGLKLPSNKNEKSELVENGVLDITNKGNIEQLLLSEFAYEEELFLSRLANNEALYFEKEIPPTPLLGVRNMILDQSIYNWGTPKTIAIATAIAFQGQASAKRFQKFTYAIGNTFSAVEIQTLKDVQALQNHLDVALNAANGLDKLLSTLTFNKDTENILFTSRSSFEQVAFQESIHRHRNLIKFLIIIDTTGTVEVWAYNNGNKKSIRNINLPLQEIWATNKKQSIKKTNLLEDCYPIPFPTHNAYKLSAKNAHHEVVIDRNNAVYLVKESGKAAEFLCYTQHQIDYDLCELLSQDESHYLFFTKETRQGSLRLSCLDLQTDKYIKFDLEVTESYYLDCFEERMYFIHIYDNNIDYELFPDGTYKQVTHIHEVSESYVEHNYEKISLKKKIEYIAINSQQQLVLHKHFLSLTNHHIMWKVQHIDQLQLIKAKQEDNIFLFNDGSRIIMDPRGMLILESSHPNIETIYIPTILETSFAIGTSKQQCGNIRYLRNESLDQRIPIMSFNEQYLQPFINHIYEHYKS